MAKVAFVSGITGVPDGCGVGDGVGEGVGDGMLDCKVTLAIQISSYVVVSRSLNF